MPVQTQGLSGTVVEVDPAFRAQRTSLRPADHGALGHYRISMQTGTMAAGLAANAEVFQFRWTNPSALAVVHKIALEGMGSIVAFAAGVAIFRVTTARSWTADGGGGTAATMTTNNGKVRTSHATSGLGGSPVQGTARIASTGALTAGTKTLDAVDMGACVAGIAATAGAGVNNNNMFIDEGGAEHPIVLAANEGIVIRATVPATGTWTAGFMIDWTEMTSY